MLDVRAEPSVDYLDILLLEDFENTLFSSQFLCLYQFFRLLYANGVRVLALGKREELAVIFDIGAESSNCACDFLAVYVSYQPRELEQLG